MKRYFLDYCDILSKRLYEHCHIFIAVLKNVDPGVCTSLKVLSETQN